MVLVLTGGKLSEVLVDVSMYGPYGDSEQTHGQGGLVIRRKQR